jgi:hypothetical protein
MTQVDQFFMSPPDQFLMSFDNRTYPLHHKGPRRRAHPSDRPQGDPTARCHNRARAFAQPLGGPVFHPSPLASLGRLGS